MLTKTTQGFEGSIKSPHPDEPIRQRTQRAFLKSRDSTARSVRSDFRNARSVRRKLASDFRLRYVLLVKTVDFNQSETTGSGKPHGGSSARPVAVRQAAAAQQRRASLVGDGAKWRITNFKQVARAMSQWA